MMRDITVKIFSTIMIINTKVLSLPPLISTSWENVASLHWDRGTDLIITMKDGAKVTVPQLPLPILQQIFKTHSDYLETRDAISSKAADVDLIKLPIDIELFHIPLNSLDSTEIGAIPPPFLHNPNQANFPDLPPTLLQKMSDLLQVIGIKQFEFMPMPEPQCNCLFCQVSRTVHRLNDDLPEENMIDELISDNDLRFKEWDITQLGETRYQVTHPLDKTETYEVSLENPVSCNCGHSNCQHIKAVLRS